MSETGIAVIPRESALEVFTAQDGMKPYLDKIRAEIDSFKPDLTTPSGRQAIASIAYKVAKSKTYLDSVGKELADAQKEIPKKIDAARKLVRDTLDQWKDEVRKPLTDWEQAEDARVVSLRARLDGLCAMAMDLDGKNAAALADKLELARNAAIDVTWQEFQAKAAEAKAQTVKTLEAAHAAAVKREADEAELIRLRAEAAARLRRENEERIAKEAAENARREAEEKAARARERAEREAAERLAAAEQAARDQQEQAERKRKQEAEAAAKREADLKREREQAERQKQEAEDRARLAERQGRLKALRELEQKAAAEKAEAEKREANKAHQAKVTRAALAALVEGGVPEDAAKKAITLIAGRKIPAVSIAY